MPPRPTALLVMSAGAARRQVQATLAELDLTLRTAAEPFEATLALGQEAADLVVLDLDTFRARDGAFLRALRRRWPGIRVLLLLPEGARRRAAQALRAGADAYVLSPCDPVELGCVARSLLRPAAAALDVPPLARLSAEVAHAVSNPLQALSLRDEASGSRGAGAEVRELVGRVREVVRLLEAHGQIGTPRRERFDLGRAMRAALESATSARVAPLPPPPPDGPVLLLDPGMLGKALETLLRCLGGLAHPGPVPVRARVRRGRRGEAAWRVEILAEGLRPAPAEVEGLPESVLRSDETHRSVHPGLAYPATAARLHGGELAVRAVRRGLLVSLLLPA